MELRKIQVSFEDQRGEIIDILEKREIDSATLITSKRGAVRGNHYHKKSVQYAYIISGRMRLLTRMPGEELVEAIAESGDLVYTPAEERHTFIALEDSVFLVLTKGPRGGKSYEADTYRLAKGLEQK